MMFQTAPLPPLVVCSDDGVVLFSSVNAARGYLEVPDVEEGVYGPAFDSEGRLMTISPPKVLFEARPRPIIGRLLWKAFRQFNPVDVVLAEDEPHHEADLAAALRAALGDTSGADSLERLVAAAVERFGVI